MKPLVCKAGFGRVQVCDCKTSKSGVKKWLCTCSNTGKARRKSTRGNSKKTAVRAANKAGRTAVKRETKKIIKESQNINHYAN